MPVMSAVDVRMIVREQLVGVAMGVVLVPEERDSARHQHGRDELARSERLTENRHRRDRTDERGDREERGLACRAERAHGAHGEHDAHAVAEDADQYRRSRHGRRRHSVPERGGQDETARAGTEGLPPGHRDRIAEREPRREVVVERPGEARARNGESSHELSVDRAGTEAHRGGPRHHQQRAENRARTEVLAERRDREQHRERRLQVQQQRPRDARDAAKADQHEHRSDDAADGDHPGQRRKVPDLDRGLVLRSPFTTHDAPQHETEAGAEIEEGRERQRSDVGAEALRERRREAERHAGRERVADSTRPRSGGHSALFARSGVPSHAVREEAGPPSPHADRRRTQHTQRRARRTTKSRCAQRTALPVRDVRITDARTMARGALDGISILELGEYVSAPYCAKLFADYGADVVKLEPPAGDPARTWGPFPGDRPDPEKSGTFFFLNTNKRGVTLDPTTERGRDLARALAAAADVVIENHQPGAMASWGLDYATLAATNPKLVMISITPFGQTGPYSDWLGTDLNAFHLSGASSRYCGRPGEAPLEHGTFAADFYGAVAGAAWGLAAVYGRARVGGGQHVDVSCAEAIAATFVGGQNIGGYAQDGRFERRTGVGMPLGAPATILPCKDGHVWMLALEPGQWNGLARVMGNPEWMTVDIFQDMYQRAQNADAIYPLLVEWTMEHGKREIMDRCQAEGVPVTAVFTVAEAAEHPHLAAREYLVELEHPALGRVRDLGAPFKLPASPGGPTRPAPLLGQHNAEVYGTRLGLDAAALATLRRDGVI